MSPSGLLIVDKPSGMTSHDVVARVRRILGTRKVGHAGTLDPMATGVLVLGVGSATRLLGHLSLADKDYRATARLGVRTVSDDADGEAVERATADDVAVITDEAIRAAAALLVGDIEQRPSAVSAIKVGGRRAYERVRSGEDVHLAPRRVRVERLEVTDIRRPDGVIDVDLDVSCTTGTYVRALARDIGDALGIGGHLTVLRRTRVGAFTSGVPLGELEEHSGSALIGLSAAAERCFPVWRLTGEQSTWARVGRRLPWTGPEVGEAAVALLDGADLVALARNEGGVARYLAVFPPDSPASDGEPPERDQYRQ